MLENSQNKIVLVATGASGGHVFPALAVAEQLKKKGFTCIFVGNNSKFVTTLEQQGYTVEILPARPWNVKNPLKKFMALLCLFKAFFNAFSLIHKYKTSVVFGTGGYATVALMLASKIMGVPTLVAEQNVLPGRANRFISRWADKVCLTFESSRHYLKFREGVMKTCGNPIRESIVKRSLQVIEKPKDKKVLMITGGSQGARILSDILPEAVSYLPANIKNGLQIIQQTRPEDEVRVKEAYQKMGVDAQVSVFFEDMPALLSKAHLLIARSGASTLCEASLFGLPAIYVPLKIADGHQILNAKAMECVGAALVIEQQDFTAKRVSAQIIELLQDDARLAQMAAAAKKAATPNAAQYVAEEVVRLSNENVMQMAENLKEETSSLQDKG